MACKCNAKISASPKQRNDLTALTVIFVVALGFKHSRKLYVCRHLLFKTNTKDLENQKRYPMGYSILYWEGIQNISGGEYGMVLEDSTDLR